MDISENMFTNLTENGLKLYGKIQSGETALDITGVKIGSGYLSAGETAYNIAALKQPENVNTNISAFSTVSSGIALATVVIGSAQSDYYLREIGVYANDPDAGEILYTYCNFGDYADHVKSYNGTLATLQEIDLYFAVGNAKTINIDITGAAYVTPADFKKHTDDKDNPHSVTAEQVGFTNKAILDGITETRANEWDDANEKKHSHSNADILSLITSTAVTAWNNASNHSTNKQNPHGVTKSQIGLGNVTNESKTTMFRSPTFTGTPTAPTAAAGTASPQIANTAFVQAALKILCNALAEGTTAKNKYFKCLGNLSSYAICDNFDRYKLDAEAGEQPNMVVSSSVDLPKNTDGKVFFCTFLISNDDEITNVQGLLYPDGTIYEREACLWYYMGGATGQFGSWHTNATYEQYIIDTF